MVLYRIFIYSSLTNLLYILNINNIFFLYYFYLFLIFFSHTRYVYNRIILFHILCFFQCYNKKYHNKFSYNNQNTQFISSKKIRAIKYKINYYSSVKNLCVHYIPLLAIATLTTNTFIFFTIIILQLLLSISTYNVITIFMYFIMFHQKNKLFKNIFTCYLCVLFGFVLYYGIFLKPLKIKHIQYIGIITTIVMSIVLMMLENNISPTHIVLLGGFTVYSLALNPYNIREQEKKLNQQFTNDYRIYTYV